ncbi:MAG TPA: adenylate/guanylate cyclase domain-containing protein [Patescibacteria group bacterium]|nr:adenylate/guanylate cyclase domain-containing protein [Patescibacteria group bacterium]
MISKAPVVFTPTQPASRTRGHVLVVDDEEANRVLLRDPLEARGFSVVEAENGPRALSHVGNCVPDVILLDVMMPGMDGFQVCKRLKSERATAHVPVLLVTALSERKERLLGIEAGANDFLNKPVDVQDLILRVGNAVSTKALFDQLQCERQKCEQLLLNTLPASIADRMKNGEVNIADFHSEVTVLVADLVGFTALVAHVNSTEVVSLLNEIFSQFDKLSEKHGVEKIKTMGDAYMVASGLNGKSGQANSVAHLALDMQEAIADLNQQYGTSIQVRIGVCTGNVIAGVIGRKRFAYDIWGDTVNLACRLEGLAEPGAILASASFFQKVGARFTFDTGETRELRGFGPVLTYRLVGT